MYVGKDGGISELAVRILVNRSLEWQQSLLLLQLQLLLLLLLPLEILLTYLSLTGCESRGEGRGPGIGSAEGERPSRLSLIVLRDAKIPKQTASSATSVADACTTGPKRRSKETARCPGALLSEGRTEQTSSLRRLGRALLLWLSIGTSKAERWRTGSGPCLLSVLIATQIAKVESACRLLGAVSRPEPETGGGLVLRVGSAEIEAEITLLACALCVLALLLLTKQACRASPEGGTAKGCGTRLTWLLLLVSTSERKGCRT